MINERVTDKLAAAELLPALYQTQHHHWWSVGMRAITLALLEGVSLPAGPLLEVGCGGGAFLSALCDRAPARAPLGTDLNPVALAHARREGHQVFQGDLHHLPLPDSHLGTLLALDAFDQEGVILSGALREAERVLQPGGLLLLRVSAYDWLRGPHDVAFGTGRRYRAGELRAALAAAGLLPERLTYANSLLLLPAVVVRLAQQGGQTSVESQLATPAPLDALFRAILRAEARWLRHASLPVGLSLYALARKPGR